MIYSNENLFTLRTYVYLNIYLPLYIIYINTFIVNHILKTRSYYFCKISPDFIFKLYITKKGYDIISKICFCLNLVIHFYIISST